MSEPRVDSSVRELGAMRPRLRASLKFTFQEYNGQRCCVIEDPLTSKFHRIGLPAYLFLRFLDGKRTFSEAFARSSMAGGREAITEPEAISFVSWLVENGLADFGTTPTKLLEEQEGKQQKARFKNAMNLLFIRCPLGNPDGVLEWANQRMGWICHPLALMVWLSVLLAGTSQVLWGWDRFSRMSQGVLSGSNGFWMACIWIFLKVIHEFGHGLVSKHYGCRVREAGLYFIMFFPVTFVDATASWGLPSKWRRMHVAAAGMWAELFVAGIAATVWGLTSEGLVNTLAYNTVFMASVSTILFNANPLMRFDGYYILSDYLEIPNLSARSMQPLLVMVKKALLCVPKLEWPDFHDRETWVLIVYGSLAFVWRIVIMLSLIFAAAALFKGGGLILAVLSGAMWIGPLLAQFYTYLTKGRATEIPVLRQALPRLAGVAAVLAALAFVPVHVTVTARALVQCGDLAILRAECPGFINRVFVQNGAEVHAGQPLVDMRNLEERTEMEKLALKVKAQEARTRLMLDDKHVGEYQAEAASQRAMQKQLEEVQKRIDSMDVRAPVDGVVVGWKIDQRVGRFLHAGDEIVRVGSLPANELKIAVPESDIAVYREQVGYPIHVAVAGRWRTYEATLKRVTARANRDVMYPELTTLAGGSLPVVERKEKRGQARDPMDNYELLEPYFEATARLAGDQAVDLRSGEMARVKFRSRIGVPLWRRGYAAVDQLVLWLIRKARQGAEANSVM